MCEKGDGEGEQRGQVTMTGIELGGFRCWANYTICDVDFFDTAIFLNGLWLSGIAAKAQSHAMLASGGG